MAKKSRAARVTEAVLTPGVERRLDQALDHALRIQAGAISAYVDRFRKQPGATPAGVITSLERQYLASVTAIGAASGGVAAVPGLGTTAALASGLAEVAAFVEATALFTLAVAEIHGLNLTNIEVRRALVLAVVLGDSGAAAIEASSLAASHWAPVIARGTSREALGPVNRAVVGRFVARFGARQSALALGRALPLGIGAGVGALGNAALARASISAARKAFGPAPEAFGPRIIEG